jgi:hypothetical protein
VFTSLTAGIISQAGTGGGTAGNLFHFYWNTGTGKVEVYVDTTKVWTQP